MKRGASMLVQMQGKRSDSGTEAVPITPQWLQKVVLCNVACTTAWHATSQMLMLMTNLHVPDL